MRCFILLPTILVSLLALTCCAVIQQDQAEQQNEAADTLLDVDAGVETNNENVRQARQYWGYYRGPFYGGHYGGYGRPYYGGYGYGQPYYGGYYRPNYGLFGGFFG